MTSVRAFGIAVIRLWVGTLISAFVAAAAQAAVAATEPVSQQSLLRTIDLRQLQAVSPDAVTESLASYALSSEAAPLPTAVYDISAHVVVMPDGSRLEAHSGLGVRVDDPRFVRLPMRGATPPAVYDLRPREHLFHGVAALRLVPVLGNVFGRSGLLTHIYMLHGRAESNGCVVFRDYDEFLRGYRGGRVRRLRVVPAIGGTAIWVNSAALD